ncbi:WD40-repeat-containing domain protein [Phyllosticta citriasiana]|uniref:WD40-repeat-containing domain protein n=1 Tax=Phyllosticta citriasiana TaxID=595635 RepID=A0ABR1K930_9PEZI
MYKTRLHPYTPDTMRTAKLLATDDLGLPPDSYIYALRPVGSAALAVLSSDNSIRTFDRSSLKLLPDGLIQNAHDSVTCLENWDDEGNVLATSGRDGVVRFWDRRTRKAVMQFENPKPHPLSALTTQAAASLLIAGAELQKDPPGDAPIHAWDTRSPAAPRLSLLESHTDTITELALHPEQPSTLLSASTDGLVSIFDLRQSDEDDALRAVLNHRSAVHHAGWLGASTTATSSSGSSASRDVWVFGTDETLGFYRVDDYDDADASQNATTAAQSAADEIKPISIGDVREKLGCEYVVNVYRSLSSGTLVVAAGNTTSQHLDLLPLQSPAATDDSPLAYSCATTNPRALRLPGAHGDEIVRDVWVDESSGTLYSCGEDGKVRAWDASEGEDVGDAKEERKKEKKRNKKARERYRPY